MIALAGWLAVLATVLLIVANVLVGIVATWLVKCLIRAWIIAGAWARIAEGRGK